jgi:hypothetical protein
LIVKTFNLLLSSPFISCVTVFSLSIWKSFFW